MRLLQLSLGAGLAVLVGAAVHGALVEGVAGVAVFTLAELFFHAVDGKGMAAGAHIHAGRTGEGQGALAIGHAVAGLATHEHHAVLALEPFLGHTRKQMDMGKRSLWQ